MLLDSCPHRFIVTWSLNQWLKALGPSVSVELLATGNLELGPDNDRRVFIAGWFHHDIEFSSCLGTGRLEENVVPIDSMRLMALDKC
jgi:hypothetical protein